MGRARGVVEYEEMTNLPTTARERLAEQAPFSTLTLAQEARSDDGTVKALFHTHDGHPVEAVLMRYRDGRRSVCVSSQSDLPLTCTFCATGQMRFRRNLDTWEILDAPIVVGHAGKQAVAGEPGVVDEDVDVACLIDQPLRVLRRRDVRLDRTTAELRRELLGFVLAGPVADDDVGAGCGEPGTRSHGRSRARRR